MLRSPVTDPIHLALRDPAARVRRLRGDVPEPSSEWLLASGAWSDSGLWDDASAWNDGA
jgi:hypothetical protein